MLDKQSRGREGVFREGVWKPELSEKAYSFWPASKKRKGKVAFSDLDLRKV